MPLPLSFGICKIVFYVYESICFVNNFICIIFKILHISDRSYGICLSDLLILHLLWFSSCMSVAADLIIIHFLAD